MKLNGKKTERLSFGKKLLITSSVAVVVATGAAGAFIYTTSQSNKEVPASTSAVEQRNSELAQIRDTAPVEQNVATPNTQQTVEPIEKPIPTPEENKARAKQEFYQFFVDIGMKGNIQDFTDTQWHCMETRGFLADRGMDFADYDDDFAVLDKYFLRGDANDNQEGNQKIFFDGRGTCITKQYTGSIFN